MKAQKSNENDGVVNPVEKYAALPADDPTPADAQAESVDRTGVQHTLLFHRPVRWVR